MLVNQQTNPRWSTKNQQVAQKGGFGNPCCPEFLSLVGQELNKAQNLKVPRRSYGLFTEKNNFFMSWTRAKFCEKKTLTKSFEIWPKNVIFEQNGSKWQQLDCVQFLIQMDCMKFTPWVLLDILVAKAPIHQGIKQKIRSYTINHSGWFQFGDSPWKNVQYTFHKKVVLEIASYVNKSS